MAGGRELGAPAVEGGVRGTAGGRRAGLRAWLVPDHAHPGAHSRLRRAQREVQDAGRAAALAGGVPFQRVAVDQGWHMCWVSKKCN